MSTKIIGDDILEMRPPYGDNVTILKRVWPHEAVSSNKKRNAATGSGTAFLVAQLIDVQIFDKLRRKEWFIAPFVSSLAGSFIDTLLFFSISFYKTSLPWLSLALGDFTVKILMAIIMLIPFRMLLKKISDVTQPSARTSIN